MDTIAIVDFGGQYAHLIANRIRRLGVYSEIIQPDGDRTAFNTYKGIILSGSPYSVLEKDSPRVPKTIFHLATPVLGLCYGHQLIALELGGTINRGATREYGLATLCITNENPLFKGLSVNQQIWMSHGDTIETLPKGFTSYATTDNCCFAAIGNSEKNIYGLQFHPEVTHTLQGMKILDNFITLCNCDRTWNPHGFIESIQKEILQKCRGKKVFLLVSGGVDSTVTFALLNKTLGSDNVIGLHIDNGLMRQKESEEILSYMRLHGFDNLHIFNATSQFLNALKDVYDPEEKRKIIGSQFIAIKQLAQEQLGLNDEEWMLAQGTIYPDTIESAGTKHADTIKTHHNRVDVILALIEKGLVIEPLEKLYKDEVRQLGTFLELPKELLWRHPFPGPGLGIRAICSDGESSFFDRGTSNAVSELAQKAGYEAVVLPVKSVGVQGDSRTYTHPALVTGGRDWNALEKLSTHITNTVYLVNRVLFGIFLEGKPEYTLHSAYLTADRLKKLRRIDFLINTILKNSGEYEKIWQVPIILLPLINKSGKECLVLRPITSQEAMTARFIPLCDETISAIAESAKSIPGIGDIFFDITHKPPGTIEWE